MQRKLLMSGLGVLVIGLIIGVGLVGGSQQEVEATDYTSPQVQVEQILREESGEGWQVNLQIPKLTGTGNPEILDKWNQEFAERIDTFAEEIQQAGYEFAQDAKANDWGIHTYEAATFYQVTYNQHGLLSLKISYYQYTGGAHGMTHTDDFILNLQTGERLTLSQVVGRDDFQEVINQFIQEQIQKNPNDYFSPNFSGIRSNPHFYLTEDHLVIYFDLYEIAPYAAGMPSFEIPLALLEIDLKKLVQ